MIERGSSKHGPHVDDEMKHEMLGVVKGGKPAHVEEWRQTEPFPDETDDADTQAAVGLVPGQPEAAPEDKEESND